jgi:hypothetical protein
MPEKIIITTTVNPITQAIRAYDRKEDWYLLVVGDRKTPEYKLDVGYFMSWEEQQEKYPDLCKLIGPDSVQRGRMIAFIEAYKRGAELVASIDDDNFPDEDWPGEVYVGVKTQVTMLCPANIAGDPLADIVSAPHRGYPLELRQEECWSYGTEIVPLVQENVWRGEPDVSAVHRISERRFLTANCFVKDPQPFSFIGYSPINTQNTIIHRSALRDFPANVPFVGRYDDIVAGYLFQAKHPGATVYCRPTVTQAQYRSHESLLRDLADEMWGYQNILGFLGGSVALPKKTLEAIALYEGYFA